MKKRSRFYPRVRVDTAGVPAVGQAGGVLLIDTVAAACLDAALSAALATTRNNAWLHTRAAALNLRRLLALGLTHAQTAWTLA